MDQEPKSELGTSTIAPTEEQRKITCLFYEMSGHRKQTDKEFIKRLTSAGILGGRAKVGPALRAMEGAMQVFHSILGDSYELTPPPRRFDLELLVRKRYRGSLREAIVVQALPLLRKQEYLLSTFQKNRDSGCCASYEAGMRALQNINRNFHECLGGWGGTYLLSCLRADDRLAVGSGRGPYYAAKAIYKREGENSREISAIMSLSGTMSKKATNRENPHFDADDTVGLVALSLSPNRREVVNGLLVSGGRPAHLTAEEWLQNPPTVALIGVGAFAPGHRMYDEGAPALREIWPQLEEIKRLAKQIQSLAVGKGQDSSYCCVGDICNHLFFVPPSMQVDEIASLVPKIEENISIIEAHIAGRAVTIEQLAVVAKKGGVVAVAGGKQKKHILSHLLSDGFIEKHGAVISHLITDECTAQWLTERPDAITPALSTAEPAI